MSYTAGDNRAYQEQCRTNYLLGEILEQLQKLNAKGGKKRTDPKSVIFGGLPPLALLWNSYAEKMGTGLKLVIGMDPNGQRAKQTNQRWKANEEPEYWERVLSKLHRSAFCTGKNDRGWKANFDWFIRPDTAAWILEGKYDDCAQKPGDRKSVV